MMPGYQKQVSRVDVQTEGFICPVCKESIAMKISHEDWETMASNNAFGWPWKKMLPRGLTLAQLGYVDRELMWITEVPDFEYLAVIQRQYHLTHSRCYRTTRKAWVVANQAACDHENWTWQSRCPECHQRRA
jgi:hypothetical protein